MLISQALDARVVSEKPFTRNTGKNSITKIRVVQNPSKRSERNPARFFNAEGWGKLGEDMGRLAKGDVVTLVGEMKLDKYTDKNGNERVDDVMTVTQFRVQKSTAFFEKPDQAPEQPMDDAPPPPVADDDIPF